MQPVSGALSRGSHGLWPSARSMGSTPVPYQLFSCLITPMEPYYIHTRTRRFRAQLNESAHRERELERGGEESLRPCPQLLPQKEGVLE